MEPTLIGHVGLGNCAQFFLRGERPNWDRLGRFVSSDLFDGPNRFAALLMTCSHALTRKFPISIIVRFFATSRQIVAINAPRNRDAL